MRKINQNNCRSFVYGTFNRNNSRWNAFECGEHRSWMYQRAEAHEFLAVGRKNLHQRFDPQVVDTVAVCWIGNFALTIIAHVIVEIGWCWFLWNGTFSTANVFAASGDQKPKNVLIQSAWSRMNNKKKKARTHNRKYHKWCVEKHQSHELC